MVVIIMAPSNLYQQLSGFFFLCTGFFIDLLVLRVFLLLANICLLVSAAIGRTSWLGLTRTEEEDDDDIYRFALDGVIWASLQIFINGMSVIRIYYDERKIVLNNDDEEALFRYVYRHSGLSKAQFQNAFCNNQRKKKKKTAGTNTNTNTNTEDDEDEEENELKIVEYEPKEKINIDRKFFFIVLEGVVSSNVKMVGSNDRFHDTINFKSGQMFPIGFMAYDFMPTENIFMNTYITPIAATKVKLYRIPLQKIRSMSQNPKTRDAWMALIISMMASIAERPYINDENNNYDQICVRSHLFDPFKENEEPNPLLAGSSSSSSSSSLLLLFHPILHLLTYIKMSFTLPWPFDNYPTGLRHNLHPPIDPSKDAALFKRKQEIITSYRRSTLINEFKNSTKMHLIRTTSYGDDLQLLNNNNNSNNNNNNDDDIENNNNSDHHSLDESSTSTSSNSKISIPLGDQQ